MTLRWLAPLLLGVGLIVGLGTKLATSAPPGGTGGRLPGKFIWHDLASEDVDASRKFYSELLGWKFKTTTRQGHPYYLAYQDKLPVAGLVGIPKTGTDRGDSQWVSYLSVPDLDAAVAEVSSKGGKVLVRPSNLDKAGRAAVVADPQGALLGLASTRKADPADPSQPPMNGFFWTEYLARDAALALAFYKELVGYESSVDAEEGGLVYYLLRRDRPRAGMFQIPASMQDINPTWLPYVRVTDAPAAAARAEKLGGKILVAPGPGIRKGTLAVIADPTGAPLALQQYPY